MENKELGRCKDCKHWTRGSLFAYIAPAKAANVGYCDEISNDLLYYQDIDEAQNQVEDSYIGCQNLYTHENFGCIHFKSK